MQAMALAVVRGWAINIGGGMHHAHWQVSMLCAKPPVSTARLKPSLGLQDGAGWCAYADAVLGIRKLRAASGGHVLKVLYVDLDVHQVGNRQLRPATSALRRCVCSGQWRGARQAAL